MNYSIGLARRDDAERIAWLHAESWRSAYRGMLPDAFLDDSLYEDRLRLWNERMATPTDRQVVFKAECAAAIDGFACLFLDEDRRWGALLDNLHVRPSLTGRGIGAQLLQACRDYVQGTSGEPRLHLWVFEANIDARRFYERHGAVMIQREIKEILPDVRVASLLYAWKSSRR